MTEVKTIVCLANSYRGGVRCVAGKEITGGNIGNWIRPVSNLEGEEIQEYKCHDGQELKLLDIIDVPVIKHCPKDHQKENWLLDTEALGEIWQKKGRLKWSQLQSLKDKTDILWSDEWIEQRGMNDRISNDDVKKDSLRLIHVNELTIISKSRYNGGRSVQAYFQHNSIDYQFWVTDPECINKHKRDREDAKVELDESYLTVSLGLRYEKDNFCYKLVAGVMERKEMEKQ